MRVIPPFEAAIIRKHPRLTFTLGARLGPYEIVSAIGAGGMGEVYRARDTRLRRDVALKILPDAFALDPEGVARFKREAQVLASLNHPHIAQIYGIEESGPVRAIVMEVDVVDQQERSEVYVRGYPSGEPIPVSASGGVGPVWSRDGRTLFYESAQTGERTLMSVPVPVDGGTLKLGTASRVVSLAPAGGAEYGQSAYSGPR